MDTYLLIFQNRNQLAATVVSEGAEQAGTVSISNMVDIALICAKKNLPYVHIDENVNARTVQAITQNMRGRGIEVI